MNLQSWSPPSQIERLPARPHHLPVFNSQPRGQRRAQLLCGQQGVQTQTQVLTRAQPALDLLSHFLALLFYLTIIILFF